MLNVKINFMGYQKPIFNKINISFKKGYSYAFVGNNGCGKTTFLNIIAGIIPKLLVCDYDGEVLLNNKEICSEDISFVFQNSENSLFYRDVKGLMSCVNQNLINKYADRCNYFMLQNLNVSELSFGQKKLLCFLKALLSNSKICLMDEPTNGLDEKNKKLLFDIIKEMKKEKIIIISTHDEEALNHIDKITKIDNGNLNKVLKSTHKTGFRNSCLPNKKISNPLLKLNGFKYKYEKKIFVCTNEIIIPKNSVSVCSGQNGCGKTTLGRYIIKYINKNKLKIKTTMMMGDFNKQLFAFDVEKEFFMGLENKKNRQNAEKVFSCLKLNDVRHENIQNLSEGKKKSIILANLLLKKSDLLILDEPFDNLDNQNKILFMNMIKKYKKYGSILILDQEIKGYAKLVDYQFCIQGGVI